MVLVDDERAALDVALLEALEPVEALDGNVAIDDVNTAVRLPIGASHELVEAHLRITDILGDLLSGRRER
jgi:hypothetical protein